MATQTKMMSKDLVIQAVIDSFKKLNPVVMIKNPVMFVVEVGTLITLLLSIKPDIFAASTVGRGYNIAVFFILLITVLFANFAEALAEGRGKAQADTLQKNEIGNDGEGSPTRWLLQRGSFYFIEKRRYCPC